MLNFIFIFRQIFYLHFLDSKPCGVFLFDYLWWTTWVHFVTFGINVVSRSDSLFCFQSFLSDCLWVLSAVRFVVRADFASVGWNSAWWSGLILNLFKTFVGEFWWNFHVGFIVLHQFRVSFGFDSFVGHDLFSRWSILAIVESYAFSDFLTEIAIFKEMWVLVSPEFGF